MDRLHLLAEVVFALGPANLVLDLRFDLASDLQHLLLAQQSLVHQLEAVLDSRRLEYFLSALGVEAGKVLGDEIGQPARVVQGRGQRSNFVCEGGRHLDDFREQGVDASRQRVDLDFVFGRKDVGENLDVRSHVGGNLDDLTDTESETALDHKSDRAVGHAHRLVDSDARSDRVEIGGSGALDGRVLLSDDSNEVGRFAILVQQSDRAVTADSQRKN